MAIGYCCNQIKNESYLRVHLIRGLIFGALSMEEYKAFFQSQNKGRQAASDVNGREELLAKECKADPVRVELLEGQGALCQGLFSPHP
jgi:hypothetical protein